MRHFEFYTNASHGDSNLVVALGTGGNLQSMVSWQNIYVSWRGYLKITEHMVSDKMRDSGAWSCFIGRKMHIVRLESGHVAPSPGHDEDGNPAPARE